MINNFKVEFIKINTDNAISCSDFMKLGFEYMKEVAADKPFELHSKFLNSILIRQNEKDRWLIGIKVNNEMIGFTHFKIDRSERVDWGYILEFYIKPMYRRKGLGRSLYSFIKQEFITNHIKNIWLTADKVTGEPFWFSMGFKDSGQTENELKILEIAI